MTSRLAAGEDTRLRRGASSVAADTARRGPHGASRVGALGQVLRRRTQDFEEEWWSTEVAAVVAGACVVLALPGADADYTKRPIEFCRSIKLRLVRGSEVAPTTRAPTGF